MKKVAAAVMTMEVIVIALKMAGTLNIPWGWVIASPFIVLVVGLVFFGFLVVMGFYSSLPSMTR